ncbi:hypothetical protein N9N66_03980 [Schleiferiaceae bacterium]|nr:hypothetical protein [Schleiferiaceae bacterium]
MKQLLTTLALLIATSMVGQTYSTFYGTYDVNKNVNVSGTITKDVNVSGTVNQNVNKTVRTIDYGALAAANAQQEANRLMARRYSDEREARIAEAIAADPFAAFTYATKWSQSLNKREAKKNNRGFTNRTYWEFRVPHPLLFSNTAKFGVYRNSSESGVVTEISLGSVYNYVELWHLEKWRQEVSEKPDVNTYAPKTRAERFIELYPVGEICPYLKKHKDENVFTHKAEIAPTTVYGHEGYKGTVILERDYSYEIREIYFSQDSYAPMHYSCSVEYTILKNEGTFEDLEGRRHYLKRLLEEIIATAQCRYY